jgi:hypothetical protein
MHSARTGRWFSVGRVTDYQAVNKANWDDRAPAHAESATYNLGEFITDPAHLSRTVTFDRPLLGDLSGLRGVHLQCHIGHDTLSLARLGATMTGVDFSPKSLEQARGLAERTGTAVLEAGLTLTGLVEHTTVPWEALPGQMRQVDNGEWQLTERPERLPHTYTLQAVRNPV